MRRLCGRRKGFVGMESGVHQSLRSFKEELNVEKAWSVLGRGARWLQRDCGAHSFWVVWAFFWSMSSHLEDLKQVLWPIVTV